MRAILSSLFGCLLLYPTVGLSQPGAEPVRLIGIINVPPLKLAAIRIDGPRSQTYLLSDSQREGSLELINIDPVLAMVRIRLHGTNDLELQLKTEPNQGPANLIFENLPADLLLTLYSKLAGRTVLRPSALPGPAFTLRAQAPGKTEAVAILENALAEKGVATIPDGEHFVIFVAQNNRAKLQPAAPPTTTTDPKSDVLPAGTISFRSVDLSQAAMILAELKGQTLDRTGLEKIHAQVSLQSQTALTKAEAIYAMEMVFRLNGIKTLSEGNKLRVEYFGNN